MAENAQARAKPLSRKQKPVRGLATTTGVINRVDRNEFGRLGAWPLGAHISLGQVVSHNLAAVLQPHALTSTD